MLTIDFETLDPYISKGFGPGWVFALRGYKNPEFKILGASVKIDDNPTTYVTDLETLREFITLEDTFCMHNARYDLGCILYLFKMVGEEFDYKDILVYDTLLMAKLVDQNSFSYSLDTLAKKYCSNLKSKKDLTDYVWDTGSYQGWYFNTHSTVKHTRPSEAVLEEYVFSHLDKLPEELVGDYCNHDVEATYELYTTLSAKLKNMPKEFDYKRYSDLILICLEMQRDGIRVDVNRAQETLDILTKKADDLSEELFELAGNKFNINSPQQVVNVLKDLGLTGFNTTPKGKESADKEFLEGQEHPACKLIIKIKNYRKLVRDFLSKIIDYQHIHRKNGSNDCRIFPSLNIFGATKTGRFSSSGARPGKKSFELNMQQIPKRGEDDDASKYVRGIFIAEPEENWISADYSNQEQRLQLHDAVFLGLEGAAGLQQELIANPAVDFHQTVANFCDIQRKQAKTVNLGLSYGMGEVKLCKSLGLPTEIIFSKRRNKYIEVAGKEGKMILEKYHNFLPFMKGLQNYLQDTLREYGYIKTLAGRKLIIDKPMKINNEWISFERKGLSKRIQGSAADVTIEAMIKCWKAGLKMLITVHDEICISTNKDSDIDTLKNCMENAFELNVPMPVEITKGKSWAGD